MISLSDDFAWVYARALDCFRLVHNQEVNYVVFYGHDELASPSVRFFADEGEAAQFLTEQTIHASVWERGDRSVPEFIVAVFLET